MANETMSNNNPFSLNGRRAMVTGGSKGIGSGIAEGMAKAGADVVLVGRSEDALAETAASLNAYGVKIAIEPFDLSKTDEIESWYNGVVERCGPCDILVNNAGTTKRTPAADVPLDEWEMIIRLNLTAVFALSQAFARERIAAGKPGKIVNIASLMTQSARRGTAAYTASKGGIGQLTKALAVDWAEKGILVNAIAPGYIATPLTTPLVEDPEFNNWVLGRCPVGRWGTPGDLAGPAVFLASPASDFMTGDTIFVDGGFIAAL